MRIRFNRKMNGFKKFAVNSYHYIETKQVIQMEILIEIPEKKAPFVLELLRNLKFLKIKQPDNQGTFENFQKQWNALSLQLPQGEPDISEEEIAAEIREVRANRNRDKHAE